MAYRYNKESYYQESAMPRRGINGMTKIDWINFEQHVFCADPKGELQGSSE
jgi:hypothetical protein